MFFEFFNYTLETKRDIKKFNGKHYVFLFQCHKEHFVYKTENSSTKFNFVGIIVLVIIEYGVGSRITLKKLL
jgi:hypothetical protein